MSIQPPMEEPGEGTAPSGVCSRMLDWKNRGNPCGEPAAWHIIWNSDMQNGPVCETHMTEARINWVYLSAHRYSPVCAAASTGQVVYSEALDRCIPASSVPESPDPFTDPLT